MMALIHRFQERTEGAVHPRPYGGYCHLAIGQASTVGAIGLPAGDCLYASYRDRVLPAGGSSPLP
jgi:TPP-dependent pyruvate/acetoin dehydrogenase alpha subunit